VSVKKQGTCSNLVVVAVVAPDIGVDVVVLAVLIY
jgi:hypothetical protein